ncbi:hypothetical protein [uncultured Sphingomonas sp.]|uniref:hypothetical protein n=1 Tax=uncultured Sphingomonas sp. TaxID=158754 RepID=UPI00262D73CD|nr:hypothetical protein [uncultured Sphingomonas sp.]
MPDIRSTHLSEAIAFGLGYKTHAALRDAIASASGRRPAVADGDPVRFAQRLMTLGYGAIEPGIFSDALAEPTLSDTPFAFFKRGDRAANDRHYHFCEQRGQPMITVRMARRYAELQ